MTPEFDILIIGSGIAGLSAALAASPQRVAVLTRGEAGRDGASVWAQGGIAAAMGEGDSPRLHAQDTWAAGNHHNDAAAVAALTEGAAAAVDWLQRCGVPFDRDGVRYSLGREAAHGQARIVHACGDATGAAVMQVLAQRVREAAHIQLFENHQATRLLTAQGRVNGVAALGPQGAVAFGAGSVVLASGGIGGLYRYTTNPHSADGSGLALALQAGAILADLEFVQFHPTALRSRDGRSGQLPLLTEALRGAGALLLDGAGRRFMPALAREAELAPRDVVARAVWQQLERGETVWLDASRAVGADFPQRFPTVFASCQADGIDPRREPMPVVPAQHYHMGGVRVNASGRSSVPGLYAVGEVACSGVHGANRLASNSLLEGLVCGRALGGWLARQDTVATKPFVDYLPGAADSQVDTQRAAAVRELLWRHAGLVRDATGLREAAQALQALAAPPLSAASRARIDIAGQIVAAALRRRDSLGAHFRRDAAQLRTG